MVVGRTKELVVPEHTEEFLLEEVVVDVCSVLILPILLQLLGYFFQMTLDVPPLLLNVGDWKEIGHFRLDRMDVIHYVALIVAALPIEDLDPRNQFRQIQAFAELNPVRKPSQVEILNLVVDGVEDSVGALELLIAHQIVGLVYSPPHQQHLSLLVEGAHDLTYVVLEHYYGLFVGLFVVFVDPEKRLVGETGYRLMNQQTLEQLLHG